MKKLLTYIYILGFLFIAANSNIYAATTTATPTPDNSVTNDINNKINELKNRISNKVSELKLVEKRGFIGTVTDNTNTQLTLTDTKGNTRLVDVDELTKFQTTLTNSTFGVSDIKKGMVLEILGLYNKESQHTLARVISYELEQQYFHGTIVSTDSKNFTFLGQDINNKQLTLDIQSNSQLYSYTKADGLAKVGFSKITTGSHIIAAGY